MNFLLNGQKIYLKISTSSQKNVASSQAWWPLLGLVAPTWMPCGPNNLTSQNTQFCPLSSVCLSSVTKKRTHFSASTYFSNTGIGISPEEISLQDACSFHKKRKIQISNNTNNNEEEENGGDDDDDDNNNKEDENGGGDDDDDNNNEEEENSGDDDDNNNEEEEEEDNNNDDNKEEEAGG